MCLINIVKSIPGARNGSSVSRGFELGRTIYNLECDIANLAINLSSMLRSLNLVDTSFVIGNSF